MRIVLIVQSLIILAGAYYVYTLTRPTIEIKDEQTATTTIQVEEKRDGNNFLMDEDSEDVVEQTNSDGIIITDGHNDLGMEFPTPDDGMLESR